METELLGIVDNMLYISPFYGGDHAHEAFIDNPTKRDLLERGVKEFPSYDHIEAILYGLSYEEYCDWRNRLKERLLSKEPKQTNESDLPF